VAAVSGSSSILGALSSVKPLQAHESGNAVASSRATQGTSQPWAAVSLTTASKLLANTFS
jgi:hypothetical protein